MWRRVVDELAPEYADVQVEHMLVDAPRCRWRRARAVRRPRHREHVRRHPLRHRRCSDGRPRPRSLGIARRWDRDLRAGAGSAPDIAGRGANPTAMLRSTALSSSTVSGGPREAEALVRAIEAAILSTPTADLGGSATTAAFGSAVREQLSIDDRAAPRTVVEMRLAPEAIRAPLWASSRTPLCASRAFAPPAAAG
jgi:hypothetical protein